MIPASAAGAERSSASPVAEPSAALGGRRARRTLVIAAVAKNLTMGFAFGSFGPLVIAFENEFHVDRSISTLPLPLVLLTLSLVGAASGALLERWSIRGLMIVGAALSAAGYGLVCFAGSMTHVLLTYTLLVGPGAALLGTILPSALAANWFDAGLGRALGIVNMPLLVGVMPLLAAWLLGHYSFTIVFAVMSGAMLLFIPALMFIVDRPDTPGPHHAALNAIEPGAPSAAALAYGAIARLPEYWSLTFMGCVLSGAGVAMSTHIVPMTQGWGLAGANAALLLSMIGFMGVIGSPLCGWLVDRMGGAAALALNAILQALLWLAMLARPSFGALLCIAVCLGLTSGGLMAAINTALSRRFGAVNFGRTYGLFMLVNLPLNVALPPLFGHLFVATGSYAPALAGQVVGLFAAAAVGVVLHVSDKHARLGPVSRT